MSGSHQLEQLYSQALSQVNQLKTSFNLLKTQKAEALQAIENLIVGGGNKDPLKYLREYNQEYRLILKKLKVSQQALTSMDISFKMAEDLKTLERKEEDPEKVTPQKKEGKLSWKEQQVLKMLSTPDQKPSDFSVQGQAYSPSPSKIQIEIQNQFKSKDTLFQELQECLQKLKIKEGQKIIDQNAIQLLHKSKKICQENKVLAQKLKFLDADLNALKEIQYKSQNSLNNEIVSLKKQLKEKEFERVTEVIKVPVIQTVKEQVGKSKRPKQALNKEILTKGVSSQRKSQQFFNMHQAGFTDFSIEEDSKEDDDDSQECNVKFSDEEEHGEDVILDIDPEDFAENIIKQVISIGVQTEEQRNQLVVELKKQQNQFESLELNLQQARNYQEENQEEINLIEKEISSVVLSFQQSQDNKDYLVQLKGLIETLEERFCQQALIWEQEILKETKANQQKKQEISQLRSKIKEIEAESYQSIFEYKKLKKDVQVLYKQLMLYLPKRKDQEDDEDYLQALLAVINESKRIKQEHQNLIETIGENKRDLLLFTSSSLSLSPSQPMSEIYSLKEAFNQQKQALEKQFQEKIEDIEQHLKKEKLKLVEQITQNNQLQKDFEFTSNDLKNAKDQLFNSGVQIESLKEEVELLKKKNAQIILRKEQNEDTIRELTERNHILMDSVEKLKLEILSFKKQVSKMEAELLQKEKENEQNQKLLKQNDNQFQLMISEKEHLLSLVDFNQKDFEKNPIFKSGSFGGLKEQRKQIQTPKFDPYQDHDSDVFKALKGLTQIVMGRDLSPTKKKQQSLEDQIGQDNFNLLRQLFNENAVEMLELYENRVDQRDLEIDRLESELEHYVNQNITLEEELTAMIETITNLADVYDELRDQQVEINPPKIEQLIYRFSKTKVEYHQQLNSLRQSHGKNQLKLKTLQEQTNLRTQLFKASIELEKEADSPSKRLKADIASRHQLQVKELTYQVESLQLANEQLLIENDAFRRDLRQAKKKEDYLLVLRKQTEAQREQIKKMLKEQDKITRKLQDQETSKSEMGRMVTKMDQELKKEKSNVLILRQQLHEHIFDNVSTKQADHFEEDSSFLLLGENSKTDIRKQDSSGLNITLGSLQSSPDRTRLDKLHSNIPPATKSHAILPILAKPSQDKTKQLMSIIENQALQLEKFIKAKKDFGVQEDSFSEESPQEESAHEESEQEAQLNLIGEPESHMTFQRREEDDMSGDEGWLQND